MTPPDCTEMENETSDMSWQPFKLENDSKVNIVHIGHLNKRAEVDRSCWDYQVSMSKSFLDESITENSSPGTQETSPIEDQEQLSQTFFHNVKWSSDGSYLLSHSDDQILRLFSPPTVADGVDMNPACTTSYSQHILSIRNGESIYDYCWNPLSSVENPASFFFAVAAKATPVKLFSAFNGETLGSYRTIDENEADIGAFSVALYHDVLGQQLSQQGSFYDEHDYDHDHDNDNNVLSTPSSFDGMRLACGYHEKIRIFDCNRPGSTPLVDIHTRSSKPTTLDKYTSSYEYIMKSLQDGVEIPFLSSMVQRKSQDNSTDSWNTKTRANYGPKQYAPGQRGTISTICAPPSPQYARTHQLLAAGSYADEIGLYDSYNGNLVTILRGSHRNTTSRHPGTGRAVCPDGVTQVKWSPDGLSLFVGYRKRDWIDVWDLRLLKVPIAQIQRPCHTNQKLFFDIDCSGQWLCSGYHSSILDQAQDQAQDQACQKTECDGKTSRSPLVMYNVFSIYDTATEILETFETKADVVDVVDVVDVTDVTDVAGVAGVADHIAKKIKLEHDHSNIDSFHEKNKNESNTHETFCDSSNLSPSLTNINNTNSNNNVSKKPNRLVKHSKHRLYHSFQPSLITMDASVAIATCGRGSDASEPVSAVSFHPFFQSISPKSRHLYRHSPFSRCRGCFRDS